MTRSISRQGRLSLAILSGILLAAGPGGGAYGQKTKSPSAGAAAAQSAEAAIEARGERQLRPLKYSGWRKLCFQPSETEMVCRTTISGVTETGQEMLRVDLIEGGARKGARLQIFVPPMLFLEAGVRIAIGQADAVNIPFAWCFSNTCVAAHAVGTAFIRQMRSGQTMTLKVVDSRIATVTTSLPLDQFASVNQGPPHLIFGRSLQAK